MISRRLLGRRAEVTRCILPTSSLASSGTCIGHGNRRLPHSWKLREDLCRRLPVQKSFSSSAQPPHNISDDIAALRQMAEKAETERNLLQQKVDSLTQDVSKLLMSLDDEGAKVRNVELREGETGFGGAQSRVAARPNVDMARRQPAHVCELGHQALAELAMQGNHCAHRERLLREIMGVENVSWERAHDKLAELDAYNERYYWVESMPYRIGITCAFTLSCCTTALVFYAPVAEWFGTEVVGEEVPEGMKSIAEMSIPQCGTWTWAWMEPMIGTASFILLCAQLSRSHLLKMNMKSYADLVLQSRANRLAAKYPMYDRSMVRAWAKHMPVVGVDFFPIYEGRVGLKGPSSGL